MPTISVDITGFYFGLDEIVVDTNDSVADAMRKAVVKSVSLNTADANSPILVFETGPRGFSTTISVVHFVPPRSRQVNQPPGGLSPGIYSYSDKLLGQNPVAAWQYYVIGADGRNKSKEDATTRERFIVPCENSDVAGTGNPTPVTFADSDQIIWRLVNISFGPSAPLPNGDQLEEIKRTPKALEMRDMRGMSKFA